VVSQSQRVNRMEVTAVIGGVELGVVAYLLKRYLSGVPAAPALAVTLYVLAGCLVAGAVAHHRWYFSPRRRWRHTVGTEGWLDKYDLRTSAGERAMRAQAGYIRPGLPSRLPDGRKQPVQEYATCLGRLVTGRWWIRGRKIYSPHSRGMLVLGPSGSGKTNWMVHPLLDFPGAIFVTSTKPELVEMTAAARARRGPVHVFNPANLGPVSSTFAWNPVVGCEDQAVADAQAWALVRGGGGAAGTERPDFWAQKAQEIIRCYVMAAALRGMDMGAVHYWATHPDDLLPVCILHAHPQRVPAAWIDTLHTHLTTSRRTRDSYFATVVSCVGFMDNPTVAAACRPQWEQSFDVRDFLTSNGTLYVICDKTDQRLAPLMTALTEYIFGQAKRVAAASPGGRLSGGLAMILDEVAHTTPVPLDQYAADSRGWDITITAIVQDLSQLDTTWGSHKAKTIYANLPTKVVLPGVAEPSDLEKLAYLAGPRNPGQERHVPVITGPEIYRLPRWHAYVLGAAPRACVVSFEPGYQRVQREHRKPAMVNQASMHRAWEQSSAYSGVSVSGAMS
jgi:type IV secretion system protein VirD4